MSAPSTPPLWGFEEREKLMVFYERASGSRMHANYFRPGGVHQALPPKLIDDIEAWCDPFLQVPADLDRLLTSNRIFKARNVDIGVSLQDAWAYGFSGAAPERRGTCEGPTVRLLCGNGFRYPDRKERRLLRPVSHPDGGDAQTRRSG